MFGSLGRLIAPLSGAWLISTVLVQPTNSPHEITSGTIELPGVSGVSILRDDRVLLTRNDGSSAAVLAEAAVRLLLGRVTAGDCQSAGAAAVEDAEDAAFDGGSFAYVLGSHARTAVGEAPDGRYRLARLKLDAEGKVVETRHSGALLAGILANLPFLADSIRRTPAKGGLNIEGLAWDSSGALVIGLRAPTITESTPRAHGGQEDAVVLRLKTPDELFGSPAKPAQLDDVVKLDLHGQGIRGMCYDPTLKAFWIVSGLSVEPTHAVSSPWGLWLWDGRGAPRSVPVPGTGLEQPTAVCRLATPGGDRLLLVEAGKPRSRYALLRVPRAP